LTHALLLTIDIPPASLAALQSHYTVHQAVTREQQLGLAPEIAAEIRGIVGNSTTRIDPPLLDLLPQLGIVCMRGVGHEGVDLEAARARGIVVTNGAGGNADSVADHAMALMLAAIRDIPGYDASVRRGAWRTGTSMRPLAHRKRLGILGLGDIGRRIARRAAGFEMEIAYHNRRPVPDVPWRYEPTPLALAASVDILIVVLPGGSATHHLVGRDILDALGPAGLLVNVGRGSVVENPALIAALEEGRLGGAALDVVDGEPAIPDALMAAPHVIFTPHIAGRAPESVAATTALLLGNLDAFFTGQPLLTPV
jgi:lactate dehydrogenase-like 2-hydroxyacid dehydrogenase